MLADAPSGGFTANLPAFQGTLGELAHALRVGHLTPAQVDPLRLVQDYLAYYQRAAQTSLEAATEVLPLLSRIIELKLRLLLPQPPKEDAAEVAEEVLDVVVMLEAFDDAIDFLRARREARRFILPAKAPRPDFPRRYKPLTSQLTKLADFASRHRLSHYFELVTERLTLSMALDALRQNLQRLKKGSFSVLVGRSDWEALSVAFGALLELVKEGEVLARQDGPYQEIGLEATGKLGQAPGAQALVASRRA